MRYRDLRGALASSAAICAVAVATPAMAQTKSFDVPAQSAATGIPELATQADIQILVSEEAVRGKTIRAIKGSMSIDQAVRRAAADAGLRVVSSDGRTYTLASATSSDASSSSDSGYAANEIVVTAQKRVESAQNVPIAITALSQKNLEEQKIEGGPDILRAVPNMTFSKSNFTSYNVSIRGIGTKAVSATTDPGVAVSFNNVGMIANRFFEQEFFDLERVEVLRGPQGTLYGRNATGGVINLITAKPKLNRFEGSLKGEVGNYNSRRLVGMLNVPIVADELGLRVAGAMTQRDGYDYNANTKNSINGRDLYSLRATLGFEKPWLRGNIVWERFREDDNRSRTGKQLCHRDDGPEMIGSTPVRVENPPSFDRNYQGIRQGLFSTGCKAGSLYDDDAFGTPNGLALNAVAGLAFLSDFFSPITRNKDGPLTGNPFLDKERFFFIDPNVDPYGGMMQSRNLREISSIRDPRYRAGSDILSLNLDVDLSDTLTLSSQTAFNWSDVYSFQDYNRFNTVPIINDTSNTFFNSTDTPSEYRGFAPGGIFCDPQVGCSNTLAIFDVSSGDSKQFSQELRLQSDSSGPFNFSLGGNYTKYKVVDEYYVMSNLFTMLSAIQPFNRTGNLTQCMDEGFSGTTLPNPIPIENGTFCPYIDPNPVESINGEGHNYFRSSNPYKLTSWALFGEAYYDVTDNLKLTAGLRYTRDKKVFTVVPSQLLLAPNLGAGGFVNKGYPATGEIRQKWGEFTGRFGLDWKPDWGFTDDSLVYAFYSRGYKAGGANPPSPGFATNELLLEYGVLTQEEIDNQTPGFLPILQLPAVNYAATFKPEFVNAFEIGIKNSLMGGRLTLNAGAFYYDYTDYQVSQIRDRTAVNENFDAKVWGAELSANFEPIDNLRFNMNLGYLKSRINDGEVSIDPMNRTAGNPDYVVTKPWLQLPSNCIVPAHIAEAFLQQSTGFNNYWNMCGGLGGPLGFFSNIFGAIPDTKLGGFYNRANYPEINGGAGINTELGGNELPNSPRWTASLGAEYTIPFQGDWSATIRGDAYWQAKSWARVYNLAPYDRLRNWTNFNISLRVDGPENLSIEAYVKNVFNKTPITDAFLNSDDSGLTTNVFTLDPRIIGFSIAKKF
ncbi:TonB-dependent receptor domain-containing protein [Sphingopyxis sp. NJF-3]